MKKDWLFWVAGALSVVGAVNWGLVGLFNFDLVVSLGLSNFLTKAVYTLVGVSGGVLAWKLIEK